MQALQIEQNTWRIQCPLTYPYIGSLEKHSNKARLLTKQEQPWVIDLGAVDDIDSAGLAWLLENIRHAKKSDIIIQIKGLHCERAQALAEVQGIKDILTPYLS